jgi:hypothetical protein
MANADAAACASCSLGPRGVRHSHGTPGTAAPARSAEPCRRCDPGDATPAGPGRAGRSVRLIALYLTTPPALDERAASCLPLATIMRSIPIALRSGRGRWRGRAVVFTGRRSAGRRRRLPAEVFGPAFSLMVTWFCSLVYRWPLGAIRPLACITISKTPRLIA